MENSLKLELAILCSHFIIDDSFLNINTNKLNNIIRFVANVAQNFGASAKQLTIKKDKYAINISELSDDTIKAAKEMAEIGMNEYLEQI